jgi:hypothetical protein
LQEGPEAINLWIGNSRSVTALHKDNYENIYVQITGEKHFTLLPPLTYACVAERELTPASYVSLIAPTYILAFVYVWKVILIRDLECRYESTMDH